MLDLASVASATIDVKRERPEILFRSFLLRYFVIIAEWLFPHSWSSGSLELRHAGNPTVFHAHKVNVLPDGCFCGRQAV